MSTMTKNGISTTTVPGSEQYERFSVRGRTYYQYDYRHTDGDLFAIVRLSLEECRTERDKWIKVKANGKD